ncbi:hypothetical protein JTB14_014525 [Gonioctena quinquepunctata]|nr:hypothetical protein JTB14_014525 [Gonioctena quinquepunctata]
MTSGLTVLRFVQNYIHTLLLPASLSGEEPVLMPSPYLCGCYLTQEFSNLVVVVCIVARHIWAEGGGLIKLTCSISGSPGFSLLFLAVNAVAVVYFHPR